MRPPRWMIAAGIGLALLSAAFLYRRSSPGDMDKSLASARSMLQSSQPGAALTLAQQVLEQEPNSVTALLIAGEAAAHTHDYSAALSYYSRVPDGSSDESLQAAFGRGEVLFHLGQLAESEEGLTEVTVRSPGHALAHFRLAILLGLTGRRWEAIPHQRFLVESGHASVHELILLCDTTRVLDQRAFLLKCLAEQPESALPHLGLARIALSENRNDEAETRLRRAVELSPDLFEAQAQLGRLYLERATDFLDWHSQLPSGAGHHPGIWTARGLWLQSQGDLSRAAKCYLEGLRLAPNDRLLVYQMGRALQSMGRGADAEVFLSRYELLQQLATVGDGLHHNPRAPAGIRKAAILTERLDRISEAVAWCRLAHQHGAHWAMAALTRLRTRADTARIEFPPTANLADLSDIALPDWFLPNAASAAQPESDKTVEGQRPPARFVDLAGVAGIEFSYENGADPQTAGARIIETTGGGVAVLDIDCDLFPDLYFTQGNHWPTQQEVGQFHDCLFRNLGDGTFANESASAGLLSPGFGQGVAVGDIDCDGFPDLYVGCIGPNRLFVNNGDGTFTESAVEATRASAVWTTSCLIADLNNDHLPDLYDVNYCRDDDDFANICGDASLPRACSPLAFHAEVDRLMVSTGDGGYSDVSESSGITLPNGYGLGVVAGQISGDGGLDVFIANDQVPNFLFVNRTPSPGGEPKFSEEALLHGLAVDGDGRRQGCMGIAADDVNQDQRLDFFVTNFYHESNTLYASQSDGLYTDRSRPAKLRDASFQMLGFGTQFLDCDLDGYQDLVVANGHIDDLSALGQPYRMAPQLFRRESDSLRFSIFDTTEGEDYFAGSYIGRGLARWDWNGDGREEFVVSNIGDNCSVVANLTGTDSHFLGVRLVGTVSSRDAVGAAVTIETADRTLTRQVLAGDGFQCSNQRRLVFGLGDKTNIGQISVRWPSGVVEEFNISAVDEDIVLIEEHGAYQLPPAQFSFPAGP